MKPVRRIDSSSQSCSCTSCLYKSESEQPSIRKYVAHGSRIDRLYFGKYIPLRERKLLNRLVRTRAVYDDLRARLISDSTLSLENNADLRPGKHHRIVNPLDSEKSGAILELIDIIDKGAALDPKKHSDCCSCCSCLSKSKILERNKKVQRGKKGYGQTYEKEYSEVGQTGTGEGVYAKMYEKKYNKTGQIGTGEGVYATYEREFRKTVPGKVGERYNKRGVRFKAKHIRSDPCTCTFKFSGLIKKHSKTMFKKVRPPLEEPFLDAEEKKVIENSKKNFARKSFQKYQDLRDKLEQDMKKLNETKANMKQKLQLHAKKSLEQAKQVKHKIKTNIETGVRKSLEAVKGHPKEILELAEYPEVQTTFKIKKDSLVKFKDYLKRKEIMKDWECDLKCEPEECVPEECFKIIKLRRLHKRNRQRVPKHEKINKEVKVGEAPLSKSNSSVQAGPIAVTTATHIKKHKPVLRVDGKNQVMEKRLVFESKQVKKGGGKKGMNKIVNKMDKSSVIPATYEERAFRDIKKKDHVENKTDTLPERGIILKKPHSRHRQAVRIKSSFSFDLEFYKNRPEAKLIRSNQLSGIHVHAPRRKRKKLRRRHESIISSKSSLESSKGTSENLKTRLIQTHKHAKAPVASQGQLVSKISQCECEKRHSSNVKTNTNNGTKSVSSITNNVATMDEKISKEIKQKGHLSQVSFLPPARLDTVTSGINESYSHNKQVVRIGSTFSFDIEFYKKGREDVSKFPKSPTPQKLPNPVMENVKRTHSEHGKVRRRLVQVKGTSTKAYNQAITTLHRCFCTLKRNKRINTKKEAKQKAPMPGMIDKYVETKKNYRYESPKIYDLLLPYECEPGICIPDECDPLLCKEIIDLRKQRFRRRISKSIGSYTGSRKTKSTSSVVSRHLTSARAKIVQSSTVPTKVVSTGAPKRYKNDFNLGRNVITKRNINASDRQAVHIGSSFSFNIEFYKDTQNPAAEITNKPSLVNTAAKNIYKKQKFTEQRKSNKRNKSMFTQVLKVNKYIGPQLKNCLCTLKLYKNDVPRKKTLKKAAKLTTNTQTSREAPIGESVNKGTRTKKERNFKLLPYECEPFICVPGECDPYVCLQNIKRRELTTRNISVFTDKPDMHSMSSLTENSLKKSEAILVHPKQFRKSTNMKAKYFKALNGRPRPTEEIRTSKSKQAVRIGSSFNFSIEFSKQMPDPVTLTKYPKIKQSSNVHPKITRNQGITVTKVRVNHGDTQALEPKKVNKASIARPMILKRCFCTLNLQKKIKQQYRKGKQQHFGPNTFTVGRATTMKTKIITHSYSSQWKTKLQLTEPKTKIISVSTSSFLLKKYVKSLKSKYQTVNVYSTLKIPIQSKEPLVIQSDLSMKLDIIRHVLPSKESCDQYIKHPLETFSHVHIDETSREYLKLFNQLSNQHLKRNTGIRRYLEQCFCTMNVKISHPGQISAKKKISHKIKPYECEPGTCIPGKCDPYECKKLIMNRFAKNVHKSSGTKSKSISSYAVSDAGIDSRSTQIQTRLKNHSQVTIPQRYKTQRQREVKHRQAVRLKSSFSFDLEFSKHQAQPLQKYVNQVETIMYAKKPQNKKTYETANKSSQENKIQGKATKLQSSVTSANKGTASMTKRCFCTLKLHKKGRIHREQAKFNSMPAKQLPVVMSRNVKIGTATKHRNTPVDLNDLNVYECEPGICVPGQCDPYKCLELMKRRKNFGINTIQREMNSVPSMTSEEKYKTRAVNAIPQTTHHKSMKIIKYVKNKQNDNDIQRISSRSTRPAVRIGSSFSFNIDFFKDMPQPLQYKETDMRMRNMPKGDTKNIKGKKATNDITSPSRKYVSHRATVMEKPLNDEATITARFRSPKVPENKKTLKQRCFCVLGLRNKENKHKKYQHAKELKIRDKGNRNNQSTDKPVKTAEKPTNTNVKRKVYVPYLEPYECEPGVCIPGQCDPYLCEKIIQQRLAKPRSIKCETESIQTHSASSSFGNYKRSKNDSTQAQGQTNKKRIQHISKDSAHPNKKTINADKRLVRIGSNFSFNIEFYKENVDNSIVKEKVNDVKTYLRKDVRDQRIPTGHILKSTGTETVNERHNKPKVKAKNKKSGGNSLLKRCFCTLKIRNKPIKQTDQSNKANKLDTKPNITTKTVETQSYKHLKGQTLQYDIGRDLSQYECEPFVCVPGQCDPVECLKRIKKRQQHTKDSGTITKYPKGKSIGNAVNKMKDQRLQAKDLTTRPHKSVHKTNYVEKSWLEQSYNQPRQAVRIGSNFSFNIEFFKDVGGNFPNMVANRPLEELSVQKHSKKVTRHNAKTQPSNFKNNMDSQVISTKLQTAETVTPNLKRCFCTLPLINKNLNKQENISPKIQSNPVSLHSSVGNFLKKCICTFKLNKVGKNQNKPPVPAVKYEIKGTSTKSRHATQNHIKKPVRLLEPYECEPFICVPGECDPYECLKRIQRRQVRDFGTDYKRYVKDSATDSIKQPMTRSTKAQYQQKRKFKSRGTTSLVSRRTRRSKEIDQLPYDPSHKTNRQVVRIGSNFSFNIEFFKDHGTVDTEHKAFEEERAPNMKTLQFKRPQKPSTKSRGSINVEKHQRDKKSQCSYAKRHVPCSAANIVPKRCFCTLKLLKNPKYLKQEEKVIPPALPTKEKATTTKIKYTIPQELGVYECPPLMCIPGECNPYECLEKIKKRGLMRKSRNVGTRAAKTSIASVGNRALNVRAHKVQSQMVRRRNVIASTPHSEPQSEILKSSRNIDNLDRQNKCAVRIGSNFNFNVEFFKQKLQPAVAPVSKIINARYIEEDSKSDLNKNVTAGARNFGHSYINKTKLKDQGSDAVNSLKRCFCTLQLQKPKNQNISRDKVHRPGKNVRYPQTYTVGRVSVVPVPNTVAKICQTKKVDKARSTSTDPKLLNKTTGTSTKRKYLHLPSSQCNPYNCPDYGKRISGRNIENDMHTILPFTPSKFKKESRSCLSTNNKLKINKTPNQIKGKGDLKPSDATIMSKGRRLTAKKSKQSIPTNSIMDKNYSDKDSFFCRCVRFFSRKSGTKSEDSDKTENINNINKQVNKSRTIPAKIKLTIPPKKAKSYDDNCPFICPKDNNDPGKRYSILQSGDVNNSILKAFQHSKIDTHRSKIQGGGKFVTFADTSKYPNDVIHRRKMNTSIHSKSSPRPRLCYTCSVSGCPLNKGDKQTSRAFKIHEKSIKSSKKTSSYSESVEDCQYCTCCKRKINADEISNGGGDRRLTTSSQYKDNADTCPCGKESMIKGNEGTTSVSEKSKADNLSQKHSMKKEKCCSRIKPFLEIRLDPHSHTIINKGEVKKSIDKLYSNRNLCICCKCLKKRETQEVETTKKPQAPDDNGKLSDKGAKDVPLTLGKFFSSKNLTLLKPHKKTFGPCVCGSKVCAKQSKKIKSGKLQKEKPKLFKTCVCGSDICAIEQKKIQKKRDKVKMKAKSIIDAKERKELNRRVKLQEEKDQIRRLKRIKRNKELEARVKGYKDSSDIMLAVDSLVDIGRLGFSSLTDGLRYTTKVVTDPKVTCEMLCKKCRKKDPETLLKQLQQDYNESNAGATARRLKMRCLYMKKVQSLRQKLEENAFTHFILHMADKNAKARKFKPKPVRRIREPVDFQCSLYMATLRRRPYLSVYYKWPWFYPHFMSMLNIWKQFTDIMLFLIAAIVWSPCILCMEGCRALMCCFFCTG